MVLYLTVKLFCHLCIPHTNQMALYSWGASLNNPCSLAKYKSVLLNISINKKKHCLFTCLYECFYKCLYIIHDCVSKKPLSCQTYGKCTVNYLVITLNLCLFLFNFSFPLPVANNQQLVPEQQLILKIRDSIFNLIVED